MVARLRIGRNFVRIVFDWDFDLLSPIEQER
jgi:hypothetical protein